MSDTSPADAQLTLQQLADAYGLELSWLLEIYDYGLLGEGSPTGRPAAGEAIAISAAMYGRVALIRRLHVAQGVNLAGIAVILELFDQEPA